MQELASDVARLSVLFVNTYFVGDPQDANAPWVLIDAGLPGSATALRLAAERRFGVNRPPTAIYLTHGHYDHRGAAGDLAELWQAPIYASHAEMPFLTGLADYAPRDPTAGSALGFMSLLSRAFPDSGANLRPHMIPLPPAEDALPGMPGWRWVATPGHSPGQVAFFRESDRALIAGDAFATTDLQSWTALPLGVRAVSSPPLPFTPDWESALTSVETLAQLRPRLLACGHGLPMGGWATDDDVASQLRDFAAHFQPPAQGRYAHAPARPIDDAGTIPLPPAPADPLPAIVGAAALGVCAASWLARRQRDE
ncbi:MAG: MBL fold metallo-hydrolase [Verrucomicrobia bacterium]|nr:MBL fold metallo-hydrolase [Verrucomicrobiota bacterium]